MTVAGRTFLVSDIHESAVIVGMFSMGIPALMALACVLVRRDAAEETAEQLVAPSSAASYREEGL